jgi:PTS system galactitol-specific IIA component
MKKILNDEAKKYLYYVFDETNQEQLLKQMSKVLIQKKFVKESYQDAVIEREREFPTGLPTGGIHIAIPHTDCVHVETEGFLVGVLETPVEFEIMATNNEYVNVELVFMLAIKKPENQVFMLQKLIALCQDSEKLMLLKKGEKIEEIEKLLGTII